MSSYLISKMKEHVKPFNKSIADGIALEHMMGVNAAGVCNRRAYIDKLWAINASMFPKGFKYEGSVVMRPERMFDEITREYGSKRNANIAKTNSRMIALKTSFNGEPLFDRYILIPFASQGGTCPINGATYQISPVMTDVGYSVLNNSIFIPFQRAKLTFKQIDHHYICNGQREIKYVIWSQIHNEMGKRTKRDLNNRQHIESCLAHYFFCEFGVKETFKRWAGVDVEIGKFTDFDTEKYPRDQWNVFQSSKLVGVHPAGDMAIAVPASANSEFINRLIVGMWYVIDAFPARFHEASYIESKDMWRIVLGLMIFGDYEHQGKLAENIDAHLTSFNNYLDEMTIKGLGSVGIKVSTIWELLHLIMTDMAHHLYDTDIDETSLWSKSLSVLKYVFDDLNYAITMFGYSFQSRLNKEWTATEINDTLKRSFKLNTCMRKLTSEHGEFDTVSYPGDNKAIKLTSIVVPQDRARTKGGHNKSLIGDSSRLIHVSLADVGQFKNQPKNNPDGRGRINLYTPIGHDGLIQRREEDREQLDAVQARFNR